MRSRIIPVLLLDRGGLYKTVRYARPTYVGDPINAIRLFNDMEVDELIVLDIGAARRGNDPNLKLIEEMAGEAFIPVCYGGGIGSLEVARRIFYAGVEKIAFNSALIHALSLVKECCEEFGGQSIVASIDVKSGWLGGRRLYDHLGGKPDKRSLAVHLSDAAAAGVGEILLNSVERDGTMKGYDLALIQWTATQIDVPLIACGGAGSLADMRDAIESGADAAAAGSLFVFQGRERGVLINYPTQAQLESALGDPASRSQ